MRTIPTLAATLTIISLTIGSVSAAPTEADRTAVLKQRMAYLDAGKKLLDQRQFEPARKVFQSSLELAQQAQDIDGQIVALVKIGEVDRDQQRYLQALPTLQQAADLAQKSSDPFMQNVTVFMLGRTYDDIAEYDKALALYNTAKTKAEKTNDQGTAITIENNIATIYQHRGLHRDALPMFERILTTAKTLQTRYTTPITTANLAANCTAAKTEQAPHMLLLRQFCGRGLPEKDLATMANTLRITHFDTFSTLEGTALNNIGLTQASLGNYQSAIESHQRSLVIHNETKVPALAATSLNNMGNIYTRRGNYPKALETYEHSLKLIRSVQGRDLEATTMNNIAQVYQHQGQFKRAIDLTQQAITIVRRITKRHQEATLLNNLGASYMSIAEYEQSKQAFDQALAIYTQVGDRAGEATTLNNLGIWASTKGDQTQAITYQQAALKITQTTGDREKELATTANMGRTYADIAQYAKAFESYDKALAMSRQLQNPSWEITTLSNIAATSRTIGRYDKSYGLYQEVIQQADRLGEVLTGSIARSGMANALIEQRQPKIALPLLETALKSQQTIGAKSHEISTRRSLGRLYAQQKELPQAIAALEQVRQDARTLGLPLEETLATQDLAQTYLDADRPTDAQKLAQSAIVLAQKVEDKSTQAKALTTLGAAYLATNQAAQAETVLRQAIDIWESTRPGLQDRDKVSLLETQAETYRLLQRSLVKQKQPNQALEISERGRARAFVELFASRLGASMQPPAPKLAEIQAIARNQKVTLVEYSQVSDRELYIWVIKPDGQVSFHQSDFSDTKISLKRLVETARSGLGVNRNSRRNPEEPVNSSEPNRNELATLHRLLIAPIAADLPKDAAQTVVFMPQGPLFLVPFAALEDAAGKALIESHTIATAPAIQALALSQQIKTTQPNTAPNPQNQLIVGNPTMPKLPDFELKPLPGAEKEAIAIGQLLSTQPLIGPAATKTTVVQQMPTAKVIHLATHGILDTDRGDIPGAIVLAPGAGKTSSDSLLTAGEITNMKLQADLVVLSACSTGKGDITGDGVIGLSRSLALAGVPSVMVSLWDVDDASTAMLMTEFYREWRSGKLNKAQALRQAMLTTRKSFQKPWNWAAFNLIGEPR
jgi:CHAT domain-containing protein/Tfp pilus assembly protein PilF